MNVSQILLILKSSHLANLILFELGQYVFSIFQSYLFLVL